MKLFGMSHRIGWENDNYTNNSNNGPWGPFRETPVTLTGPKSYFEIQVSRKAGCDLTPTEVRIVSLANNCIIVKTFETPVCNRNQNSLLGPVISRSFEKWAPGPETLELCANKIHWN